jgi:hypothetical protein
MKLEDFAETYRLVLKRDDCGDYFVPRLGQIYLYNTEELGVIIRPPGDRQAARSFKTETQRVVHFSTLRMSDRPNLRRS